MSDDKVRIVTYEPIISSSQQDSSDGKKSLDTVIPVGVPTFSTQQPSQEASEGGEVTIGGFKIQEVSKQALAAGMNQLMDVVEQLMTQMERRTDTLDVKLDEVELSVVVNGQGEFSLWGTGVSAGSTGAIKLKFRRQDLMTDG